MALFGFISFGYSTERSDRMYNEQYFYKELGNLITLLTGANAVGAVKKLQNPLCNLSSPKYIASLGRRFGAMYFIAAAAQNVHNYFQEWKNFKNQRITNEDASLHKRTIYF